MFGRQQLPVPCTVDLLTKEWIEDRWSWLLKQFGRDRLRQLPVALPNPEFFPDPIEKTEESIGRLVTRIAKMMLLVPEQIAVEYYHDAAHHAAAVYHPLEDGRFAVAINLAKTYDAEALIATIAHELAHVHLLGHGRVHEEEPDHEILTDLTCVAFGFGVFMANSIHRTSQWSYSGMAYSEVSKQGYLNLKEFGFAMALHAVELELDLSPCHRHLRQDPLQVLQKSIRYLVQDAPPDAEKSASRTDQSNIRFMMMGRKYGMSHERLQFVHDAVQLRNDYTEGFDFAFPLSMSTVCRLIERYAWIELDHAALETLTAWNLTDSDSVFDTLTVLCHELQLDADDLELSKSECESLHLESIETSESD